MATITMAKLGEFETTFLKVEQVFTVGITNVHGQSTVRRALVTNKFTGNTYFLEANTVEKLADELECENVAIEKDVEEFSQKMRFCLRKGFIKIPEESII